MRLSAGSGLPGLWFLAELIALIGDPADLRPLVRFAPDQESVAKGITPEARCIFVSYMVRPAGRSVPTASAVYGSGLFTKVSRQSGEQK